MSIRPIYTLLATLLACGPGEDGSTMDMTTSATTGDSDGETSTPTSGDTADPDYRRTCQPDDFVCDDFGCENAPDVVSGACYKRCTPTQIGEPDDECDEPERPFCSQVGRALGGDFNCNSCVHICVSAEINNCQQPISSCE